MYKILHLDQQPALTPSAMRKIDSFNNVILPDNRPNELILSEIKDAKYVISGATYLGEEHFRQAPILKAVVLPSAGYDYIDIESATRYNVYKINAPKIHSNAVIKKARDIKKSW